MLNNQHFNLIDRITYNLREYERAAELAVDCWCDLSDPRAYADEDTEEQMIDAWEHWLDEALHYEKVAIHHADALRRDLTAVL